MDQDDRMVGRVLSRREVVSLLGLSGVAMLTDSLRAQAPAAPSGPPFCVVQPQQTEGPYFSDVMLNRTDVRSDPPSGAPKPGAALALAFNVGQLSADGVCKPLAGAHVDIWQCDALGVYSDAKDRSFDTIGQKFLRGYQLTDASGAARFTTIYPGWYQGRAVHIHFKIRTNPKGPGGQEFTSQLYFDEAMTDRVHALEPVRVEGQGPDSQRAGWHLQERRPAADARRRRKERRLRRHVQRRAPSGNETGNRAWTRTRARRREPLNVRAHTPVVSTFRWTRGSGPAEAGHYSHASRRNRRTFPCEMSSTSAAE